MSVSQTLGQFVANSDWVGMPPSLRHEAKRSLLNFVGCALGVANTPPIDRLVKAVQPFSGGPAATTIGRSERLGMLDAAFVNAAGANLLDYDDTHLETVIHPTVPVAPALFAMAEHRGLSGAEVLHAFILGVEIECRLGNSVSPGHYARGWHITSTTGVFGAAAGTARLLGLSAQQTTDALGVAASQSSGLVENIPHGGKNVAVGNSARNGILAALFAANGIDGAPQAIEGLRGWARAAGDVADETKLTGGLGETWELLKNTYKPYPCGIVMHAIIEAGLSLRAEYGLLPDDIKTVTVSGDSLLQARGDRIVAGAADARVSIHHSAAAGLMLGAAGIREFSEEIVMRPDVIAFRAKVLPELDDSLPVGAARMRVGMNDGRVFSTLVTHARGSIEHPLTDRDIEDKVRTLGGNRPDIGKVIDLVWNLDRQPSVGPLMARLGG